MNTIRFLLSILTFSCSSAGAGTILYYQASLSNAEIFLQEFGTSAVSPSRSIIHSTANWKMKLDTSKSLLTYSDLVISNRLLFSSTNQYFLGLGKPTVQVRESFTLNIDIIHPGREWTVPVVAGVGGLSVPSISEFYGSTVKLYGGYTFTGPTQSVSDTYDYTVVFGGFQRYFDGGKLLFDGHNLTFTEFDFHGMLEFFYPAISPWVSENVDGANVFYGSPGIQRVINGDVFDSSEFLTVTPVPEPNVTMLAAGFVGFLLFGHRQRPNSK